MAVALLDTMHGATIALSTDSQTFRVSDITASGGSVPEVPASHHGTTTNAAKVFGDLKELRPITITYQNSPAVATPSIGTVQTLTITGPLPSGASTAEIMSITGAVTEADDSPQYTSATGTSAGLQMKSMVFTPDGTTFTHTVAAV